MSAAKELPLAVHPMIFLASTLRSSWSSADTFLPIFVRCTCRERASNGSVSCLLKRGGALPLVELEATGEEGAVGSAGSGGGVDVLIFLRVVCEFLIFLVSADILLARDLAVATSVVKRKVRPIVLDLIRQ